VSRAELTPLSDTQRAHVAPAAPSYARSDVPTNGTQHGMVQSPAAVAPKSNRGVVYAMAGLGVMAAVGLAGIGAAVMARKPAQARPTTTSPATPTAESPPPPPVTPTSPAAPAVVVPADRAVKVAVAPAGATVDVDGQKRDVVDGSVELKGPLGSVQKVHVVANGAEVTQAVAITEGGAIPPKVIVAATGSVSPTGKPVGPKPGLGAGGTKPTPSGTGTTLNVQRNFE
jgi:hypothetical protein